VSDDAWVFPMQDGPVAVPEDLAKEFSRPFRAYELKRDGDTWAEIASAEGYPDAEAARRDVMLWAQRAGALVAQQDRQLMLSVEVARIDRIVQLLMPKVRDDGKVDAAMAVLRAIKLKTDLLHLDTAAPAGVDDTEDATPSVVKSETYSDDLQRIIDG
jgi:hypothetical protein